MDSESHPDELDDETWMAMEAWLEKVLPAYAKESEPKIREDAVERVMVAKQHQLDLIDCHPNPVRFARYPNSQYLRANDVIWLRAIAEDLGVRRILMRNGWTILVFFLAIAIYGRQFIWAPAEMLNAGAFVVGMFASVFVFVLTPILRNLAFMNMGPLGCALVTNSGVLGIGLSSLGGVLFLMVNLRWIVTPSSFGVTTLYVVGTVLVAVCVATGVLISVPSYFFMRAKIRNNYDLVARILGMPGYEEGEPSTSQ